ncbi:MAG: PEP/pyruvate-binding domain-containing protein [Candidatus Eisenbacteria bacterium]|nr:PEP/pyruvate-binding domain-containing protein [Candidatus Eisenbacteria bacterium]
MTDSARTTDELIRFFREREKELECLYRIEEILRSPLADVARACEAVVAAIPPGWQHPEVCIVRLSLGTDTYSSTGFVETPWAQTADITVQGKKAGEISVYYAKEMPAADDGPFLTHEARLLKAIADRVGSFLLHRRIEEMVAGVGEGKLEEGEGAWEVVLDLLRQTDPNLFATVSEKMLNILCWRGVEEAERLRERAGVAGEDDADEPSGLVNMPHERNEFEITKRLSGEIFSIAAEHYTDDQVLAYLRKWIQDDKLKFLVRVASSTLTIEEIVDALRQYRDLYVQGVDLADASKRGIVVALITRFLSSQPSYIRIAKNFCDVSDFFEFLDRVIYTPDSHGKLGGKAAGLFLAKQVLRRSPEAAAVAAKIRTPRSWYVASDVLLRFLSYNNMNEVVEQKYKDLNDVRREYPHVIQAFKNGRFPPEVVQGLSVVLDDLAGAPLIVRSSSLLEDSSGAAFSGKYRSLFIANQGTKRERLNALMDAISEVYASIVGPDPIEYRAERGLLDINEEMGIMIQEVVGARVGPYFFPAAAGVAFSRNEFRWSPRIRREDGLIRMVPGLGTRAVDRVSDDYPVLVAPGQPGLSVNVAPEEVVYYSPKKVDVINLETNAFETVDAKDLLAKHGQDIPMVEKLISVYDGQHLRTPLAMGLEPAGAGAAFTFQGLIGESDFVRQVDRILKVLEAALGTPVDIEFAHDGTDFYLLQCRPQSFGGPSAPAPIPKDVPKESIVFSANRYVSNGRMPDITHIVYVDPEKYGELPERADLIAVGRTVSRLNQLLPKKRFVLIGPGRWGSRGDLKLGVSVTYSDINRTAALIEVARRKGSYTPDLSFGTHFFQDLVEGEIRYLPLYPDDEGIAFNESFLLGAKNILADVVPEHADVADTVRLIDVPQATDGRILRVLMNAELNEALGFLAAPGGEAGDQASPAAGAERPADQSWAWRLRMAEQIASLLDGERFGVVAMYVFGSTKNASAGLKSDIDLLAHFRGTDLQRADLTAWLEGWSLCLDEMNYLRTGYRTGGLLDVHVVTDEDITNKTSYAARIGAVTDPARPLTLRHPLAER